MSRSVFGFQIRVVGAAPHAARYGGFAASQTDLAGAADRRRAGRARRRARGRRAVRAAWCRGFPTGYGFTAIIVAFLGRLHPDRRV